MKVKLTYILILVLLIVKGYSPAAAAVSANHFSGSSFQVNQGKSPSVIEYNLNEVILFECSLCNENEDDDDTVSARKKFIRSRYAYAPGDTFTINYFSCFSNNSLRFYETPNHLSLDKYILQRVLRV